MTASAETAPAITPPESKSVAQNLVIPTIVAGVIFGVAGAISGLLMALHRREIECPNGTYFPNGTTDFRCFSYPHVAEGTGLLLICLMLAIITVFAGMSLELRVRDQLAGGA